MLLPYSLLADVIAIVYLLLGFVADVITTVAVGIANFVGLMYLIVADVIVIIGWLMLLPLFMCCYIVWQMLLPLWLMVMPFCRIDVSFMADVICQSGRWNSLPGWVMLWSDVITISGRWNDHRVLCYFSLSSGLLHRTSSHMWGRWYLPMFLFRDGLLTLVYRASFMVLMRFWSSLPTMLKLTS